MGEGGVPAFTKFPVTILWMAILIVNVVLRAIVCMLTGNSNLEVGILSVCTMRPICSHSISNSIEQREAYGGTHDGRIAGPSLDLQSVREGHTSLRRAEIDEVILRYQRGDLTGFRDVLAVVCQTRLDLGLIEG